VKFTDPDPQKVEPEDLIRSPAKREVFAFLNAVSPKRTKEKQPLYTFDFMGSVADAHDFIHRMRVELSRLRNRVRAQGHKVKHFKMLLKEIQPGESPGFLRITLMKTVSQHNEISMIVDHILTEVTVSEDPLEVAKRDAAERKVLIR
jgi:predicted nuclease with TOPRIM domain